MEANAIVGSVPGQPNSTDPEGLIQQPFHPKQRNGGFLMVTVKPAASATGPVAEFAFYDEKGTLLYTARKTAHP